MKRLTHKARYEAGYKLNAGVKQWEAYDRLGAYEEIGIEPEEIQELKERDAVKGILRNKGGWISVEERLPEDAADVIVTTENREEITLAWCDGDDWMSAIDGDHINVIAWMPLPEPYRKGREDV